MNVTQSASGSRPANVFTFAPDSRKARGPGRAFRILSTAGGSVIPVIGALLLWELGSRTGIIDKTFFLHRATAFSP